MKGENTMGLDNGIVLKIKLSEDKIIAIENLLDHYRIRDFWKDIDASTMIVAEEEKEYAEISIVYFRKYWGLRDRIVQLLFDKYDQDAYEIKLTSEDLPAIIDVMTDIEREGYENVSTIWTIPEVVEHFLTQKAQIYRLYWLLEAFEEEGVEYDCYFYDSY